MMYNDFQVGNYVAFEGRFYKILNIWNNNKGKTCYEIEDLLNANKIELYYYQPECISIDPYLDKISKLQYGDDVAIAFINCNCFINYVHELQNVYKILNNKDLCFSL